jgi:DNA-binding response OmpR family regulator
MSQRVLVVDDDPRLVRVVAMYLGLEGFEVVTAVDAEGGLAAEI